VIRCVLMIAFVLLFAGCRKSTGAVTPSQGIIGTWTGHYHNPESSGTSMEFEFKFGSDGSYHMGKRKVWIKGTYAFTDPRTFTLKIKNMPAGPYVVKELSSERFVFERQLGEGRVQRTELRRVSN
jgi:hypothetical protein